MFLYLIINIGEHYNNTVLYYYIIAIFIYLIMNDNKGKNICAGSVKSDIK